MFQILSSARYEQGDHCPDLFPCTVTGEGCERLPPVLLWSWGVCSNCLLKPLRSFLLLWSPSILTLNLYLGVRTRDRASLLSLLIPSDSVWLNSPVCWGFSDSTLALTMCVLMPVLVDIKGLDVAPISNKMEKQSQPTTRLGLPADGMLRHPWPTISHTGFLHQCPAKLGTHKHVIHSTFIKELLLICCVPGMCVSVQRS